MEKESIYGLVVDGAVTDEESIPKNIIKQSYQKWRLIGNS